MGGHVINCKYFELFFHSSDYSALAQMWIVKCVQLYFISFLLHIPLAGSLEGFECNLTFFVTSRSFPVTGKFSTSRHSALFDRVSNHDG